MSKEQDRQLCLACVALLKQNSEDFTVYNIAACMRRKTGQAGHTSLIPPKPPRKDCKSDCTILNLNSIKYDNEFLQTNSLSTLFDLYKAGGINEVNKILGPALDSEIVGESLIS